jgi:hypothetical protein
VRVLFRGELETCTCDTDIEVGEPVEKALGKCRGVGKAMDMYL